MIISQNNWQSSRWPNFKASEFVCKGTGEMMMLDSMLDKLQALRDMYGKSITISSGYRAPEYNNKVSKTGFTGPHTTGAAADIRISGRDAHELLTLVFQSKAFTGIGINQRGPHTERFIHVDMLLNDAKSPRPWVWSY